LQGSGGFRGLYREEGIQMGFIAITIVIIIMVAAYWHFSKEEPPENVDKGE
jgi:hypothetical protein